MEEGLVGGQGFAVDASLISADVQKQNSSNPEDWAAREIDPARMRPARCASISTLWTTKPSVQRQQQNPSSPPMLDPASQWTAARKGPAFFAYSDNYLIDTDHGVIVDVDASRSNKTAEVGAMRKMLDRTEDRFGVKPDWIAADTAYGSSDNLVWLALKRQILPFIPVFDKGERTDETSSRSDFTWEDENDRYICPGGKEMRHTWRTYSDPKREMHRAWRSPQISGAEVRLQGMCD